MSNGFKDLLGPDFQYRVEEQPIGPTQAAPEQVTPEMSLSEQISTSRELDTIYAQTKRLMAAPSFETDPNYMVDDADAIMEEAEVPEAMRHPLKVYLYDEATSSDHAKHLTQKYVYEHEQEQKLAQQGWSGLGVRLGVSLLDEGAIALGVGTAGVGVAVGAFNKANRIKNIIRMGAFAGTENALLEAYLAQDSTIRGISDVFVAGVGGALLGGALGSFIKPYRADFVDGNAGKAAKSVEDVTRVEAEDIIGVKGFVDEQLVKPARAVQEAHVDAEVQDIDVTLNEARASQAGPQADIGPEPDSVSMQTNLDLIAARKAELRASDVAPPVRPPEVDVVNAAVKQISELKVRLDNAKNPAERTKASQALNQAKRHLTSDEGTVGQAVKGKFATKTPETDALLDFLKKDIGKSTRKMEVKYNQEKLKFEEAVEKIDAELKGLSARETRLTKNLGEATKAERAAKVKAEEAKSMGAAEVGVASKELPVHEHIEEVMSQLDVHPTPKSAYLNFRFSTYAKVQRGENPITHAMGDMHMEDGVGKVGEEIGHVASSEMAQRLFYQLDGAQDMARRVNYKQWYKRKGYTAIESTREEVRLEFEGEVADAIETGRGSPEALATAEVDSKVMEANFDVAAENRVPGFAEEGAAHSNQYFPHTHKYDAVAEHTRNFTNDNPPVRLEDGTEVRLDSLEDSYFYGIRSATPNGDIKVQLDIAQGYAKTVRMLGHSDPDQRGLGMLDLGSTQADMLRMNLRQTGLDEDQINMALRDFENANKDAGKMGRAKHRTLLDMQSTRRYRNADGEHVEVPLKSLFNRDASNVVKQYTRKVGGMGMISKRSGKDGEALRIASWDDFHRHADAARQYAVDTGGDLEQVNKQLESVKRAITRTTGSSIIENPNSITSRMTRRLMDYNFMTRMGQIVFAQTAEWGNILAHNNWIDLMKTVPELKQLRRDVRTGKANASTLQVEALDALGLNEELVRWNSLSKFSPETGGGSNVRHGKIDLWMDRGNKITAYPMLMLKEVQGRLSVGAMTRGFAARAFGRKLSKAKRKRLRDLGIDDAMMERINKEIRTHSTDVDGNRYTGKGQMGKMGYDNWTDFEARDSLLDGMFRLQRRIIQENDLGTQMEWQATTAMGQAVLQFRSFPITAWEKLFLHNVKHHDMETFMAWQLSMFFGGMAYMGQMHTKSLGMNKRERDKYLKDKLTTENIGKAAFTRAGFASVMPTIIDTSRYAMGKDAMFNYRASGQQQNLLMGNPTMDLINKAQKTVHAVGGSIFGEKDSWTAGDYNNATAIVPWSNLIGVQNMKNIVKEGLID